MGSNDVQIQLIGKDVSASSALRGVGSEAANTTAQIASLGRATGGLNQVFNSAAGFAAGIAGFNGMTVAIQGTVGAIGGFKKSMEVHETGMAGILLSMTEINGRSLTWGESLGLSKDIMTQLNVEALRTAATTEELTGAFRGILGPALNAKMTINEIIQLSSAGVNAVKSIMPNNADVQRQIIQELRDLVAGGIQPSSSTLATALGLKDKDIEAAKQSSEGLFKFLMDRLKGFEISAPAYARTWQGIQDQIKEGFTLAGSQGTDQLFAAMKEEMSGLAEKVVVFNKETGKMEVNPEIVDTFRSISDTVIITGHEIKSLASDISVVAVPAAKLLGGGIKLAAEHAEAFTLAVAGWAVIQKVNVIMADIRATTAGATEAQTVLGQVVLDTQRKMAEQAATAAKAAAVEREAALAAAQAQVNVALAGTSAETAAVAAALGQKNLSAAIEETIVAKNQESAAAIRAAEIINAANAAAKLGQYELTEAIITTNLTMEEQTAVAAAVAEKMALAVAAAKAGQIELAQSILATNIALEEQGLVSAAAGEKTVTAAGAGTIAQRELAGSVALTTAAHVESGAAAAAAGATTVTAMGVARTAVGNILSSVWALAGGWLGVAAATGYAIYKLAEYAEERRKINEASDAESRALGAPPDNDVLLPGQDTATQQADAAYWEDRRRRRLEAQTKTSNELIAKNNSGINGFNLDDLKQQLSAKYPGSGDDKSKKGAKAAERAYEEQQRLQDKIADMIAKMNGKISDETSTVFESSTAKLASEVENMKRELDKSKIDFEKYGIDVSGVYDKITQYQDIMTAKIERQRKQNLAGLVADTATIAAGISGDPRAESEAEYQKEMARIKKLREDDESFKKIAQGTNDTEARKLADDYYNQLEEAARKKKIDKDRQAQLQRYDWEIKYNQDMLTLNQLTANQLDNLNRQKLDNEIKYLQDSLTNVGKYSKDYYEIYNKLAEAIEKRNDILARNMSTAVGIAIKDIQNQQYNFSNLYKDTWDDIDSSVSGHLKSILTDSETMSEGIKGTMRDLKNSIIGMFAEIMYQQYIMQPLRNWFTGLLGNWLGGGVGGISAAEMAEIDNVAQYIPPITPGTAATGGLRQGWTIVGEEGPELVNFSNPGRVYTASQTQRALSGGAAPVTVNVINQSGQQLQVAKQETKFDGAETVINLWVEGYARNIAGIQTLVPAGGGSY